MYFQCNKGACLSLQSPYTKKTPRNKLSFFFCRTSQVRQALLITNQVMHLTLVGMFFCRNHSTYIEYLYQSRGDLFYRQSLQKISHYHCVSKEAYQPLYCLQKLALFSSNKATLSISQSFKHLLKDISHPCVDQHSWIFISRLAQIRNRSGKASFKGPRYCNRSIVFNSVAPSFLGINAMKVA